MEQIFMGEDAIHMARALELALQGEGLVEPNPMVGCVIVRQGIVLGEGWHRCYGQPHAEINALASVSGSVKGATMYVTLEPCCHTGKTPPCTDAVIAAGIGRVVIAQSDPFPAVSGGGIEKLRAAGIQVESGVLADEASDLIAPFRKLVLRRLPWVIAKWAMTLDGKLASSTGHSQWISSPASRERVHQLRRRVDGVMVGRGTALADDPLLTARPPGERQATRIVVDSDAQLPLTSQLVTTVCEQPVLVAVSHRADSQRCLNLEQAGCEVLRCDGETREQRLLSLLAELGNRQMTNLLVEGGGEMLGTLHDLQAIDEVHVFVAPKLLGGRQAITPIAGQGLTEIPQYASLRNTRIEHLDGDVHISGRLIHADTNAPRVNDA